MHCNACKTASSVAARCLRARVRGPGARARARSPKSSRSRRSCRRSKPRSRRWTAQRWLELLSATADRDAGRRVLRRDGARRASPASSSRSAIASPLQGTLPGEGYRLVVEVFIETGPRGRIATWRLDIRRPRGDDIGRQPWRIVAQDRLASIEGLHRLSLHPEKQFAARNLVLQAVDFELRLPAGDVFVAETPEGVTALVLLGDGTMVFEPAPKEERGQVKLFAGTETLETPFTAAFVRHQPVRVRAALQERDARAGGARRARATAAALEVFDEDVPKSFSLDLSDLSRDVWSLLPQPGDFVAEVRTRRFDDLTYARSSGEAEDVTLFQRARKRNISAYASEQKLQSRGRFFNEDDLVDYDVLDYDIDAAFYPEREWMDGRTRIRLRVKSTRSACSRCARREPQRDVGHRATSSGGCCSCACATRTACSSTCRQPVARDFPLTLTITYSGRLERQRIQDESVAATVADAAAQRAAGRPAVRAAGAEVAVQQSQLLVPAEPGHRLRHGAHSPDRAGRLSRGRVGHSRRADRQPPRRRPPSRARRASFRASRTRSPRRSRCAISASWSAR